MEHQETRVEIFEKFTWKIDNFSHLNVENIRSEPFVLGGYPWYGFLMNLFSLFFLLTMNPQG